jgi:adenine-specific DNA-methyltransferase
MPAIEEFGWVGESIRTTWRIDTRRYDIQQYSRGWLMRITRDHEMELGLTFMGHTVAKRELGQFLTPKPIADYMASLFAATHQEWRILDAGAGTGALSKALVSRICSTGRAGTVVKVTAYEIDRKMVPFLRRELDDLQMQCSAPGIRFSGAILNADFIECASHIISRQLFSSNGDCFNAAILNPPYRKINSRSPTRKLLRSAGIETSNLYAGFLALATKLLCPFGELVAITPRSFCNGPYFRAFRRHFLSSMSLRRIHVFESRSAAFSHDSVLQENIILHAVKSREKPTHVEVSTSSGETGSKIVSRKCNYDEVVDPEDPQAFIHFVSDNAGRGIRDGISRLRSSISDIGMAVSTGRVVDFRAAEFLRTGRHSNTVPLIRPCHFNGFFAQWPAIKERKPCAILDAQATHELLVPRGYYVLVKRFSAKEERRRIVACVYDPTLIESETVGFENHLNYFHANGRSLGRFLALGLSAFLNSTSVDVYFRQFSGHTQVNATDLRSIPYPPRAKLVALGRKVVQIPFDQAALDKIVHSEVF